MMTAATPCSAIATTGTRRRGSSQATERKNNPSSAIAKYTRGAVSSDWPRNPRAEMAIPTAITVAPFGHHATCITADAGVVAAASPAGPRTYTQTTFTERYSSTTPITPITNARGRFLRGSRTSSATKFAVCHPPYAKSTGTSAAPIAVTRSNDTGRSSRADLAGAGAPLRNRNHAPQPTSAAIAKILSTISVLCTVLPTRTPKQLIIVSNPNASVAISPSLRWSPVSSRKYFANVTATAAIPP